MASPKGNYRPFFDLAALAAHHKHEMVLWPHLWKSYDGKPKLRWKKLAFHKNSRNKIPRSPGVYAFFARPAIADLDVGYLMYVGRAKDSLRIRFGKYLTSEMSPYKGRPKMATMLYQYAGYLQFRYAALKSPATVVRVEKKLIKAFMPPVNEQVEAEIRRIISAF